jgi:hypothetical protein
MGMPQRLGGKVFGNTGVLFKIGKQQLQIPVGDGKYDVLDGVVYP